MLCGTIAVLFLMQRYKKYLNPPNFSPINISILTLVHISILLHLINIKKYGLSTYTVPNPYLVYGYVASGMKQRREPKYEFVAERPVDEAEHTKPAEAP